MIFTISFDDFITEKNFSHLKNKFKNYNLGLSEPKEENDVIPIDYNEDFSIVYIFSDGKMNDYYEKVFFCKDFLNAEIKKLGNSTIQKIEKKINSEFRYNETERNSFITISINDYLLVSHCFSEINYLPIEIKASLISQAEIVINFLKNFDFQNNNGIQNKFKSSLNKTDLLVLLHLLRDKNILNHPVDSLFGNLIENNFQYYDEGIEKFKDISKANKTINEIKNGNRSVEKSIKRLKELLQNDSFFEF